MADKNIPIPHSAMRTLYMTMEIGDSVHVETRSNAINIARVAKLLSGKITMRQEGEGYRCWRTQ